MANRNECFSDFSKLKNRQGKMAFLSFPYGWPWDAPPPPPESARTYGRTDGRLHADVITKFSRLDGLPIFLTHGASLARFACWSSALNTWKGKFVQWTFLKAFKETSSTTTTLRIKDVNYSQGILEFLTLYTYILLSRNFLTCIYLVLKFSIYARPDKLHNFYYHRA